MHLDGVDILNGTLFLNTGLYIDMCDYIEASRNSRRNKADEEAARRRGQWEHSM